MSTGTAANASTVTTPILGTATASAKAVEAFTVTGWVTDNAIFIGIVLTVISLILSIVFHMANRADSKRRALEDRKLRYVSEWIRDGKTDEEIKILLKRTGIE